jgi:hypothetical protein
MLVCSVSQLARRAAIAADIAEAAIALDAPGTGNVVFATLVDDPASVRERVDAFLGQIILEAASASSVVTAGFTYAAAIVEAGSAIDVRDAVKVTGSTFAAWDSATVTAVTLSGGNLVATNTGTTSQDQGAHVAAASGKTSGKYYFEVVWTTVIGGVDLGVGVGTTASTYTGMGFTGGVTGVEMYKSGTVYANGSFQTAISLGLFNSGSIGAVAIDLDNRRAWFKLLPSGGWNFGNTGADPATNVGGVIIPAGTMVPFVTFGGSSGVANNVMTANFGASAFAGAVPSGFTAGWPQ